MASDRCPFCGEPECENPICEVDVRGGLPDLSGLTPQEAADLLSDGIARLSSVIDAAQQRKLVLVREYERLGCRAEHGAKSTAHYLSYLTGVRLGEAREQVEVAVALGELPEVEQELGRGGISYAKVREMRNLVTPATQGAFLTASRSANGEQFARSMAMLRRAEAARRPRDEVYADQRGVRFRTRDDGLIRMSGVFYPEEADRCDKLITEIQRRAFHQREGATIDPETGRRQQLNSAEALVRGADVALEALSEGRAARYPGRFESQLLIRVQDGGQAPGEDGLQLSLDGGLLGRFATPLHPETLRRLTCGGVLVGLVDRGRESGELDVTRRVRRPHPALLRQLFLRDGGICSWPGCDSRYVEPHHGVPWSQGGETALGNLHSLCRRHHVMVHEQGYTIRFAAGGGVEVFAPDGEWVSATAAPPEAPAAPLEALAEPFQDTGLESRVNGLLPRDLWSVDLFSYEAIVNGVWDALEDERGPPDGAEPWEEEDDAAPGGRDPPE